MADVDGGTLSFSIGGVLVPRVRRWSFEQTDVDVDSTAGGDTVMKRNSLRTDYTVEYEALLFVASPYVLPGGTAASTTLVGTEVAWVARVIGAHTNGIAISTGKIGRFRIEASYDGMVAISGTIGGNGVAVTYDTTPAA
jgi:hypothetical protein